MDEIVKKEESHYTDCYIAFLDLLGFKGIINKKTCDDILAIFAEIKVEAYEIYVSQDGKWVNLLDAKTATSVNMKIISDSICFYIDASIPNAFCALLSVCQMFQTKMAGLPEPILMRGGIVRGDIYASGDITFGPGLTNAYLLEEKSARYPRIIMTGDVLQNGMNETQAMCQEIVRKSTIRDTDAFYIINYFGMLARGPRKGADAKALYEYALKQLDTQIDPSVREKYIYVEKYMKIVLNELAIEEAKQKSN